MDGHYNNRSKILRKATKDEESIIGADRTRLSHVISNLLDIIPLNSQKKEELYLL